MAARIIGPVIDLRGLARTYPGPPPVLALRPADLVIEAGDYVAVTGPSGSGKSTLLHRAELLGLQGQRAEAAEQARATLEVMRARNAPPRQLIQAAVAALAVCPPDQQAGLLDLVQAQLGLVSAAAVLRKPGQRFYLREWSLAMDRLGPRTSFTNPAYWEIKAFVREFRDYPALCAAFLVERAEPLLTMSARKAEQLLAQAESLLATSPWS